MALQVTERNTNSIGSAEIVSAQASSLVEGVFVGLDSTGKLKLADFRASAGPINTRGFLWMGAQRKDFLGNVLETLSRLGYAWEGRVVGFTGLTPGADYYLSSGGGISITKPAAAVGDIDQKVGYAISATELRVELGTAVVKTS